MKKDQDWGEKIPRGIGAGSGDITNEGWED